MQNFCQLLWTPPKKFSLFSAADRLQVENFKTYFEDQWIHNTEADFLSIFETELNVTNEHERFRKKINKKLNSNKILIVKKMKKNQFFLGKILLKKLNSN